MRITIVTGYFLPVPPLRGGATERSWYGLARLFAEAGHSVTFVSRQWPGLPVNEIESGITHIRVPGFDHTRHMFANIVLDFIWGLRVSSVLPEADVIICNTITLPAWLGWAHPGAGKIVVMIGRTPKGQVGFYRRVARIYAPSSSMASLIIPRWAFARTKVIGYPIEWAMHSTASRQGGPSVTIGFVGRIHPEKGIQLLVGAARLLSSQAGLPDWKVTIVGPTSVAEGGGGEEWVQSLRTEAAKASGNKIEWVPAEFDPVKLAQLYGSMDVFCYPSLAQKGETFGVAVAEAMAAGCAVVVSSLGCFGDLVEDGRTGLIFDHRTANPEKNLAECLARLIADAQLRLEIADRGKVRSRNYDYPEVARTILADLTLLARTDAKN
jgi:glycosyltransferase involved in cell wall biosynthesis